MPVGRDRQWLLHLWLETTVLYSVFRRVCDDGHVVRRPERANHVARLHSRDVCSLVADETGLLKFNRGGSPCRRPKLNTFWDGDTPSLHEKLFSLRQRARSRVNGIFAEQLFDAQKLIVFCRAICAAQ